jgi:hypothetical protein
VDEPEVKKQKSNAAEGCRESPINMVLTLITYHQALIIFMFKINTQAYHRWKMGKVLESGSNVDGSLLSLQTGNNPGWGSATSQLVKNTPSLDPATIPIPSLRVAEPPGSL